MVFELDLFDVKNSLKYCYINVLSKTISKKGNEDRKMWNKWNKVLLDKGFGVEMRDVEWEWTTITFWAIKKQWKNVKYPPSCKIAIYSVYNITITQYMVQNTVSYHLWYETIIIVWIVFKWDFLPCTEKIIPPAVRIWKANFPCKNFQSNKLN